MVTASQAAGGKSAEKRLGNYVLRRWLAQGGMAELYLATPTDPVRAQQIVVVKRVLPQFSQDKQFVRMFAREAQLASALKHPNIVEVFDSMGLDDEENVEPECFFAMEYVHGADLSEVLRKLRDEGGTIPLANALLIVMSMCAGLHSAHEHRDDSGHLLGIVHRDVSPSNVMLGFNGGVKITDFGVAKALALTSFTQAGTRKGKLSYMSPEQAVADPVDRRTDVFAIGAVLFELTTMQRMFGGENELAVMHKLLFRERTRPSELVSNYPPQLEAIVMKATAREPDERFGSAKEMRAALEKFARTSNIALSPEALGRFVASVVEAPPHPGTDPEFFKPPDDPVIPLPGREEGTRADGPDPMTTPGPGSTPDLPTALDAAPAAKQVKPTLRAPAVPRDISATPAPRRIAGPPSPGFDEPSETEIAPPPSPPTTDFGATVPSPAMPAPPPRSTSSVAVATRMPRRTSGPSPWTFIIGGLVIAASAVGGVMMMRANRRAASATTAPVTAPAQVQPAAAQPVPTPSTAPQPAPTPTTVAPAPSPSAPTAVEPAAVPPDATDTPVDGKAATPEPKPSRDPKGGSKRDGKKGSSGTTPKKPKKPRKKPTTPSPEPEPEPATEPTTKRPPPAPDPVKKKKPRTDTLLPE